LRNDHAFTLIEVLIAVLIVSLVFGLLLESVTQNLKDLGRSRADSRAAQLGVDRMRELKLALEAGEKLEDGVQEGVFAEPDEDMKWQITVTPQTLPLPADYPGELPPSPLFAKANEPPAAPQAGLEPPLRLVQVRVWTGDEDPESVEPLVVLLAAPPDPTKLQQQPQTPNAQNGQVPPGTQKPATGQKSKK